MSTDAPAHPQWSSTPPEPSPNRRWHRWLVAGAVGWAALLLLLGYVSVRRDAPTVREQRDIGQALPLLDRAVGELFAATGPDAVLALAPRQLAKGCRITPVRDGAVLSQRLTARTRPEGGPALLDRIADALPASYLAEVWHSPSGTVHELRADGGEFVAISGRITEPGVVTLTATTGCRPMPSDVDPLAELLPGLAIDDEAQRMLTALGVTGVQPVERVGASCPGGGTAYTARTTGRGDPPTPLGARLADALGDGAVVVTDTPRRYAYRDGDRSVVIEAGDGDVALTLTIGC